MLTIGLECSPGPLPQCELLAAVPGPGRAGRPLSNEISRCACPDHDFDHTPDHEFDHNFNDSFSHKLKNTRLQARVI